MFSQNTLKFLFENRLNNSREWFTEHKNEYNEHVLKPLTELAGLLAPAISAIDRQIITEPKIDKTISRIYRDTRFSKDKSLYRDEMWLSFRRDKKGFPQYPEFFFVVMQNEYIYGCGYYAATAEAMQSLRKLILKKDTMFVKAQKAYNNRNDFLIEGETYKKSKYPDQPEEIRTWLDRKSICIMCREKDLLKLFSDNLPDRIIDAYNQMEPVYNLFIHAEEAAKSKI